MTITLALASQPYSTARADARHARRIVNNNHVLSRGQRNARDARVGRRASSVCAAAPEQPFAVDQGDAMDEQTISQEKRSVQQFDFVVVGSGIAGLSFALKAADHGRVAIITKAEMVEGCTQYAQGGVCAVLDTYDSVDAHIHDTMVAGAFLNDARHVIVGWDLGVMGVWWCIYGCKLVYAECSLESCHQHNRAVEVVCKEGAHRVLELAALGAEFTRNADGTLHLTCEGGHSAKRIVHAADVTGREIERALCAAAEAHPNIHVFEHRLALDLVLGEVEGRTSCLGVDVLHEAVCVAWGHTCRGHTGRVVLNGCICLIALTLASTHHASPHHASPHHASSPHHVSPPPSSSLHRRNPCVGLLPPSPCWPRVVLGTSTLSPPILT